MCNGISNTQLKVPVWTKIYEYIAKKTGLIHNFRSKTERIIYSSFKLGVLSFVSFF